MTKKFDDKARKEYLENNDFENLEYNNMKVRDMVVKQISVKDARGYIANYHYSQSMPDSTKFVYAGYFGDKLAGIVVYGMGAGKSQYKAIIPTIENGEYLELTRLWSADSMPRNTESKLISESLKMLPKEIKLILSFADSSKNHIGYVYQATNFYYCGKSKVGKVLITEDGQTQHTRLIGIYRSRHKENESLTIKEMLDKYNWQLKEGSEKYRYVYIRGNKKELRYLKATIKDKIEKYPKMQEV